MATDKKAVKRGLEESTSETHDRQRGEKMNRNIYDTHTAKIVESTITRNAWKVWITRPGRESGWLQSGFAWKTRLGAERAVERAFPGINFVS